MPSSRFSQPSPLPAHPAQAKPRKSARAAAARPLQSPEAVFTEAHWRALSNDLQLAFFCERRDCQRHQFCRGKGDDRAGYACWHAAAAWARKRREAPDAEEERSLDDLVEDYRAKVTRILAGIVDADSQKPLAFAPREEPVDIADAARADDDAIAERDADDATARSGPSLRVL